MAVRKTIRIDEKLANDLTNIVDEERKSENQVIEEALKLYRDFHYMSDKATVINEEILKLNKASLDLLEYRINNKTNQVLSELAIQTCIQNLIIANSLDVSPLDLDEYRRQAVEFLRNNNRVLKLSELKEDPAAR